MSATNALETAVLSLYFNNSNHANVGDATGLRGATTAGVFYISLHTADPGEAGNQTTNEAAYTNYARVSVARSGAGFTISGANASNAATVTFPTCGTTGATVTHFGIGTDISGTGNLLFKGALGAARVVSSGGTPSFAIGELDVDCD